ncbi:hypothetical protein SD10_01960 [Spirosoma radiotolerans]|uniref:Heparan-alpha-glucosaminide N-acetyltransferase catalytic domain-containing protein n=1 Tax=Spirosoma radiotolerans TaxID=1379870 RepID=A0A0E3V540_9BACT|nr:hypothetical protein SD10_01960 [Spirosoma radiotolerans]
MKRIYSIDFVRGIVMIIMALDHVRDLMHVDSIAQSPTDLATTTPLLFFTRWITYLCAPIFVFLAGTSAFIVVEKRNNIRKSRQFLVKRGIWLILLEFTLVNFGLFFDSGFHTILFEVIATIGISFIVLSLLLRLSPETIGAIGLSILLLHDLFPLLAFEKDSSIKAILSPLFTLTVTPIGTSRVFVMAYPPIPWLGILLVGFAGGKFFTLPEERRNHLFLTIGAVCVMLFIGLRWLNAYGDPAPWSAQPTGIYTFLSFINITKYPPSLLFCLITLGSMFLLLGGLAQKRNQLTDIISTYGRVPLFYFVIHFYLIHTLLLAILFMQGFHWSDLNFAVGSFGRLKEVKSGISLGAVYLVWLGILALLYKPCKWFGHYKAVHKFWWLSYL